MLPGSSFWLIFSLTVQFQVVSINILILIKKKNYRSRLIKVKWMGSFHNKATKQKERAREREMEKSAYGIKWTFWHSRGASTCCERPNRSIQHCMSSINQTEQDNNVMNVLISPLQSRTKIHEEIQQAPFFFLNRLRWNACFFFLFFPFFLNCHVTALRLSWCGGGRGAVGGRITGPV